MLRQPSIFRRFLSIPVFDPIYCSVDRTGNILIEYCLFDSSPWSKNIKDR